MQPDRFLKEIVDPGLARLSAVAGVKSDDKARVLLLAVAGQESLWKHRRQIGIGQYYPQTVGARGYWQFESTWGGPVALNDVLQSTSKQIAAVCADLEIACDELALYEACAWNDTLAVALARLLLWRDPAPLPELGDEQGGWNYYLRNWRPGAPHPEAWPDRYQTSLKLVGGAGHGKLV